MSTIKSDQPTPTRLVLASTSPRRRELIRALDIPVELGGSGGDEGPPHPGETPEQYVSRLSLEKARAASPGSDPTIFLGADTAVVIDGEVLGKPSDNAQASIMLHTLRGRVHTVVTGVAALDSGTGRWLHRTRSTDVAMRNYSEAEMTAYMESGEHWDKAGAYAVQDTRFNPAKEVLGCYLNAMGFPLCEVAGLLAEMGVQTRLRPGYRLPDQCRDCSLRKPPEGLER